MHTVAIILLFAVAAETTVGKLVKTRSPYVLKETHHPPHQWTRVGPSPADQTINLQIGLQQSQLLELEHHLYEVSDPAHARYGQHLSEDEVNDLIKPTAEASNLVHDWLLKNGIERADFAYSPAKDWIKVSLPVSAVESLLDTEYSTYEHEDGTRLVRTPKWSIPLHLHDHITTIQPTNSFFRATPRITQWRRPSTWAQHIPSYPKSPTYENPNVSAVCNSSGVTPLCLRTLYGTLNYTVQAAGVNRMGLTNYLGETSNRSDVNLFLQQFRPEAAAAAYQFAVDVIANGDNQQTANTPAQNAEGKNFEGNLDAETMLGIAWPTPLTTLNTGGEPPFIPDVNTPTNTNEPYLVWLQYMLSQPNPPQVISTPYGDDEQTVPYSYARTVCNHFAQLGARGVSLLFASGDYGVGPTGQCVTNDGRNATTFLPLFPASCPYVTTVGGTRNFAPEVVARDVLASGNIYASGGGYSNYFPRPKYQNGAVPAYTASLGGLYSGLYNQSGRAYPDLAAQGQQYITTWNGRNFLLDGTSASTPTMAAIITLVNDALIAAGRRPLGFLNPWLYFRGQWAFTDITNGSAIGCGVDGFPAQRGWDAVTGWGTPNFPSMLRILGLKGRRHRWHGWKE